MKPTIWSVILLLLTAPLAHAQQLAVPRFDAATRTTSTLLTPADGGTAAIGLARASAVGASAEDDDAGFSFRPILHAIGGAVVGGWVGYVGAQVAKSDWDKEENGSFARQRTTWVAAGAAVGVIGSLFIGKTSAPYPGLPTLRPSPRDRTIISAVEIRESGYRNALDVVRALRRDWLQTRGTNSWSESAGGTVGGTGAAAQAAIEPGRDMIIVYLDDIRLGGVDEMANIDAASLTSIRFVDSRQATYLFGSGHAHGAIVLSTAVEVP